MNPSNGGWVILVSLLVAMLLGVVHLPASWPEWLGWFRPDWLLLVLFFWVVEVPHRVGMIAMWCMGVFVDVLYADPIGLNGFILAAVTFIAWRFFERLRMYSVLQQCAIIFALVVGAEFLRIFVIGLDSERQWSWGVLVTPLITMALWPPLFLILLRIRTALRVE